MSVIFVPRIPRGSEEFPSNTDKLTLAGEWLSVASVLRGSIGTPGPQTKASPFSECAFTRLISSLEPGVSSRLAPTPVILGFFTQLRHL